MGLEITQKLGLQQFGSNKDTEAPGVYALRGSNAGQWVHRDGRTEEPNEATQSPAPAGNCYHPRPGAREGVEVLKPRG